MNPSQTDSDIQFDSNFESGNLDEVVQLSKTEFDLYMRVDTNTRGHLQWFFFSIAYGQSYQNQSITFHINNFTKPGALYSNGMRVCVARRSLNYEWRREGDKISYSKSKCPRRHDLDRYFNGLTFTYDLGKEPTDQIYFAYCLPYTFSKLTNFLRQLRDVARAQDCLKETTLCKSLSGLPVPLLTVTSRLSSPDYHKIDLEEFTSLQSRVSVPMRTSKQYAVVAARVHPGETPSSFMM